MALDGAHDDSAPTRRLTGAPGRCS